VQPAPDAAADAAAARGATGAAMTLARLAIERSVGRDSVAEWTRRARAASLTFVAGDTAEARALLAGLEERCPPGRHRSDAWLTMAQIEHETTTLERGAACAALAVQDADGDPELEVQALLMLATLTVDPATRRGHAAAARSILDSGRVTDPTLLPQLLAWALLEEIVSMFHAGDGLDLDMLDRAFAVERSQGGSRYGQVAVVRPVLLKWADHSEAAIDALRELREVCEAEGNEGAIPYALSHIPTTLCRLGRVDEARQAASEHLYYAETTGQESQRIQAVLNTAWVEALAGDVDAATTAAREVLAWGIENGAELAASGAAVLGTVALVADDAQTARTWFEQAESLTHEPRSEDPGVDRWVSDLIEALVATGALDEAERRIDALDARATRSGGIGASAAAARCRALLAAARGDTTAALEHIDAALERHAGIDAPLDAARSLVVKGVVHRRRKERRVAGEALQAAKVVFDEAGARGWAARAEAELARLGRRVGASLELTETEKRVALLVAAGMTNRQVAEQAFISVKTVEANLARIYRKLGIASRAELGARMALLGGEG
jgi:DNA-binding CsgD family transcriptional regulator